MAAFIDVTKIPELIGDYVGLDPTVTGIIISVVITVGIIVALTILNVKTIGIVVGGLGLLAVFTVLQWFDPWIMAVVALVCSVYIADWVRKRSGE